MSEYGDGGRKFKSKYWFPGKKIKNCYELGVLCSKDDKRKGITTFFKKFVLMKVAKLFQRIEFRWAIEAGYL